MWVHFTHSVFGFSAGEEGIAGAFFLFPPPPSVFFKIGVRSFCCNCVFTTVTEFVMDPTRPNFPCYVLGGLGMTLFRFILVSP